MKYRISKGYWIWAQFDSVSMKRYNKIYNICNYKLKGPLFDIHMTLSGPLLNHKYIKQKFYLLKNKLKCIKLKTVDYKYSNEFYRSLYIDVKLDKELMGFKSYIDKWFGISTKNYEPHISIYYGNKEFKEKKEIIEKLPKIPLTSLLSKLCLVYVNENKNQWKIIEKFKIP